MACRRPPCPLESRIWRGKFRNESTPSTQRPLAIRSFIQVKKSRLTSSALMQPPRIGSECRVESAAAKPAASFRRSPVSRLGPIHRGARHHWFKGPGQGASRRREKDRPLAVGALYWFRHRRCGSIETEAGMSLLTKTGRSRCERNRHRRSSAGAQSASKSAIIAGGFIPRIGARPSAR
jgi:hypothetical protein